MHCATASRRWVITHIQDSMRLATSTRLPSRSLAQRCVCEATRPRVLDAKFWPRQAASAQQQRRSLLELVSATVEMNVRCPVSVGGSSPVLTSLSSLCKLWARVVLTCWSCSLARKREGASWLSRVASCTSE